MDYERRLPYDSNMTWALHHVSSDSSYQEQRHDAKPSILNGHQMLRFGRVRIQGGILNFYSGVNSKALGEEIEVECVSVSVFEERKPELVCCTVTYHHKSNR